MKHCSTCGNDIQDNARICPYCDGLQESRPVTVKKVAVRIHVVGLKEDNPTVDEAMKRLAKEISMARKTNIKVIKIIHGYGSTGVGGVIKPALHNLLRTMKIKGQIKMFITGDEHNEFAGGRNYLLNKYPELKETWTSDRGNKGITFIEL
jgi:high-affinity K+ transport system ATPase subunit B